MLKHKSFLLLPLTLFLLTGIKAHAQFGDLLQKAKDKAAKAIEKKTAKKDAGKRPGGQAQTNIDFKSGDSLIFAENFSKYGTGAPAESFKTNGAAIVTMVNVQKGKWMALKDKATYKFSRHLVYPKHFTLEFDILAIGDDIKDISPLSFGFATDNSAREYTSNTGAYVELHYYDADMVNIGNSNPKKYVNTTFDLATGLNRPLHVSLSVNGDRMTIYLDQTKLADTILFTPSAAKNFYITAPWTYSNGARVLVSNFSIKGFSQ